MKTVTTVTLLDPPTDDTEIKQRIKEDQILLDGIYKMLKEEFNID